MRLRRWVGHDGRAANRRRTPACVLPVHARADRLVAQRGCSLSTDVLAALHGAANGTSARTPASSTSTLGVNGRIGSGALVLAQRRAGQPQEREPWLPSPLAGKGLGERGCLTTGLPVVDAVAPSPQPSPARGEGVHADAASPPEGSRAASRRRVPVCVRRCHSRRRAVRKARRWRASAPLVQQAGQRERAPGARMPVPSAG